MSKGAELSCYAYLVEDASDPLDLFDGAGAEGEEGPLVREAKDGNPFAGRLDVAAGEFAEGREVSAGSYPWTQ